MIWDIFISHANEDKASVARPLTELLENEGLKVWLDENQVTIGDSLRKKLDEGLSYSKFGIVIISPDFILKEWTQRELGALQAKEFGDNKVILPVWHNVTRKEIIDFSPLLADRIAVSTTSGIINVKDEILKALSRSNKNQNVPLLQNRYKINFDLDNSIFSQACDTIHSLFNPSVYKYLEPKNEMCVHNEWMGSDSEMTIKIVYDLYLPIMVIKAIKYNLERSFATFNANARIKYAILDLIYRGLIKEDELANLDPCIDYIPRVSNWRIKRKENPQKYWWQGISEEKLSESKYYFIEKSVDELEFPQIIEFSKFKKTYKTLYNGIANDKQALGLLSNAIYGYQPKYRPVYNRLVTFWYLLYKTYLEIVSSTVEIQDYGQVRIIIDGIKIPNEFEIANDFLYEPIDVTVNTIRTHILMILKTDIERFLKRSKDEW